MKKLPSKQESAVAARPMWVLLPVALALLGSANPTLTAAASAPRPNIVLIMADDVGYSDIGCFGGEIHTPNLDQLAAGGLRFTQFYNGARCCPTRASLLTGLYSHMAGIGHMGESHGPNYPGYTGSLNNQCRTIAEVLRGAGYGTYMVGKWHVAHPVSADGPQEHWPLQRGFEKFYGTITGAGSFYDPTTLCRGNTFITPVNDPDYRTDSFYYTDALTDNAIRFLQQHRATSPDRPFFLYVSYTAAHWPLHAKPEDIERYRGKYHAGYEAIRQARIHKLKRLGLMDPRWQAAPTVGDWNTVAHREWEERCMEVYAAMIDCMDQNIGRLMESIASIGQRENTIVLYLQDNGACAENMGRDKSKLPKNPKPMGPDDLQPQIWPPMQTRDGRSVRSGPQTMPGPADTYVAYGENWANVSDTPFRFYKHWVHEGGISTPLIVHWPRGVAAQHTNGLVSAPAHLIDIMATCVDLAGAKYPGEAVAKEIHPLPGISLRPTFTGQPLQRGQPLFWEHEGNRAVREGKWKLVARDPSGPWELYDMEADRTEMDNLAAVQPERVKAMAAQWATWAKSNRVLPWIWKPNYGAQEQRVFELQAGMELAKGQAPQLAGRGFTLSGAVHTQQPDGVLVAQGGVRHGFTLFLQNGRLKLGLRQNGRLTVVQSPDALPDREIEFVASLTADGGVTLKVNDEIVARGNAAGVMAETPIEGLQVGWDGGDPVAGYGTPNRFQGQLVRLRLELN